MLLSCLAVSAVTVLTGTAAAVSASYTAPGISGLGNEAVTLSDATIAATALSTLDGKTTGVINASSVTTLTGSVSDVAAAYAANTAGTISPLAAFGVRYTSQPTRMPSTESEAPRDR